ncbi:DEAD/DEAH box helicase [soil metagenome]
MADFKDLGLREELLSALEDEDLERPTALQEAVIPALRRGTNVVARTSAGAGKTLAYGLGVLDRLQARGDDDANGEADAGEVPLRLLVLTATGEVAGHVALSLFPYSQAVGLSITVAGGSWSTAASSAEVLVTTASDLMGAVRSSALKLEDVETIVIDGAATIAELGDWESVDAVLDLIPRDAQRVVFSPAFTLQVQDLVERRVKRALSYPAESVLAEERGSTSGSVGYVLVSEREKIDVLARQLREPRDAGDSPPVIFCRSDDRASDLAEALSIRGFVVGSSGDGDADVAIALSDATREEMEKDSDGPLGQTISFDVPADARTLTSRHAGDVDAVILVEPRELPHLKEVAGQALLACRPVPLPLDPSPATARLTAFRNEVRRSIREEDIEAQMLVLEPLLDEFSAVEVAAALASLLRNRQPARAPEQAGTPAQALTASAEAGAPPAAWSRLFVGVGSRDEIRPGDIVGAIAGESNIPGTKIGKIEIRDSFSIVEVDAGVADTVIRAVNGTTIKGRSVRVDYDRGADRARRTGGAMPPRRTERKPPRE